MKTAQHERGILALSQTWPLSPWAKSGTPANQRPVRGLLRKCSASYRDNAQRGEFSALRHRAALRGIWTITRSCVRGYLRDRAARCAAKEKPRL